MSAAQPPIIDAAWTVLLVAVGVLVFGAIFAFANRYRLKRKPPLPAEQLLALQAELLDAIKAESANQRTVVLISRFWRGGGIKPYQRNAVVEPLIRAGHVTVHKEAAAHGFLAALWETLSIFWAVAGYRPPAKLILTDRTWLRMAHEGVSGHTIVFERVDVMNLQSQSAGGDIVQSPQTSAGNDADVHFRSVQNSQTTELNTSDLVALVVALRQDAPRLRTADERTKVRNLATKLENELDDDEPDGDAIEDGVSRAERYLARTGGLMAATAKLFDSWQRFRSSL